jgi:hypothetical protein
MARGQVIFVSKNGAMLVVQHDDGFTLVEMIGDEGALAIGDQVAGDWDAEGGEPIRSAGSKYDAYFQGTWGSREAPIEIARRTGG